MDDLFWAIKNGNLEKVKELIDAGADVNASSCCSDTPLYFACKLGNTQIAKLLIDSGADLYSYSRYRDPYDGTERLDYPITIAFEEGNFEIIRLIADQMEILVQMEKERKKTKKLFMLSNTEDGWITRPYTEEKG